MKSTTEGPIGKTLKVYTGDTTHYFEYARAYERSYLKQVFRERLRKCPSCSHPYELFPGLVLEDESGQRWNVKLQATFVPAKPEETNELHIEGQEDEVPQVWSDRPTFKKRNRLVQHQHRSAPKR